MRVCARKRKKESKQINMKKDSETNDKEFNLSSAYLKKWKEEQVEEFNKISK